MKATLFVACAGSLALLTACASTQSDLADKDPSSQECRRIKETGTNLPERICMTVAEWEAYDEQAAEEAKEFRRNMDRSPGGKIPSSGMSGGGVN